MKNNLATMQITVIGDGTVGKTCMLLAFTTEDDLRKYPYIPTVFENYAGQLTVDGKVQTIQLWDTAGQEGYERLRPLSYHSTSCFVVCYAIDSTSSYANVSEKWIPEVRHFKQNTPLILVGTKVDLRVGNNPTILKISDGETLRRNIRAYRYLECSAMTREGIQDVFETAVRAVLNTSPVKRKIICALL